MPNSTSDAIQRCVDDVHACEEEGQQANLVHISIQQWSTFDDFAVTQEVPWWCRYRNNCHPEPDMADRGHNDETEVD